MKRSLILLSLIAAALAAVLPVDAQGDINTWCRQFLLTEGQQGWQLSYEDEYGAYTLGAGFSVTDYGNTSSYELGGLIRIHLDFSGTVNYLEVYSREPDFSHIFVDWNSPVSDSGPTDVYPVSQGASPATIAFDDQAVSGTLGLEFIPSVDPLPFTAVIFAIRLEGTGTNPFGADNCEIGVLMPAESMYQALATAQASLDTLPNDLTAPDGVSILPESNPSPLFGYAKWLLSPAATDEWAGPFAPVFNAVGVGLGILVLLLGIYILIYVIAYGFRWVAFLFTWVLRIVDIIAQIIQAALALVQSVIGSVVRGVAALFGR